MAMALLMITTRCLLVSVIFLKSLIGFGGAIEWKGFDVSIFFQGTARVSIFEEGSAVVPFSSGYKNNNGFLKGVMEDRWTVDNPNPNARYPRTIRPSDALDNNNTKNHHFGYVMRLTFA